MFVYVSILNAISTDIIVHGRFFRIWQFQTQDSGITKQFKKMYFVPDERSMALSKQATEGKAQ